MPHNFDRQNFLNQVIGTAYWSSYKIHKDSFVFLDEYQNNHSEYDHEEWNLLSVNDRGEKAYQIVRQIYLSINNKQNNDGTLRTKNVFEEPIYKFKAGTFNPGTAVKLKQPKFEKFKKALTFSSKYAPEEVKIITVQLERYRTLNSKVKKKQTEEKASAEISVPKSNPTTCQIPQEDNIETIQKEQTSSTTKQQVSTEELERRAVECYNQKSHMTSVPFSQISQYKTEDDIPDAPKDAFVEARATYKNEHDELKSKLFKKEITYEEHSRLQREASNKLTTFEKTNIYYAWYYVWQSCRKGFGLDSANNVQTLEPLEVTGRNEKLSQDIAENVSGGEKVKKTADNVTDVTSIAVAKKSGTKCTDKLKSLSDDIKDLSISDLAKKLGVAIEDLLENGVDEIKEFFGELDPQEIEDNLKELFKDNIIYDALGEIKDLGTSIAQGLSAGAGYIDSRIKRGIESLKKKSFKELITDLIELPFKATFSIIGGIANQLNKTLCNGNLLENISDLLGDIDDGINFFTGLLSNKDLGDLLSGKLSSGTLAKLLRIGIIAATLKDRLSKDILSNQLYVNAPTTLTTTRPGLSALLAAPISPSLNTNSDQGGLWDPDVIPSVPIQGFTLSNAFVVNAEGFNSISDSQVKVLLTEKYDALYSTLNFDNPESSPATDITLESGALREGDVLFNVGITGDNSVGESDGVFTSILTLTYVIHKRVLTTDDECKQKLNTKSVTYDNVPFYGIGDTAEESRNNAFAECKNKVINDVNNAKAGVINF